MNAPTPQHSTLHEGWCPACGADLRGASVYCDEYGAEVSCTACPAEGLDPEECQEPRTEAQAAVWALVKQARQERDEARRQAEQLRSMLRPVLSPVTLDDLGWLLKRGEDPFTLGGRQLRSVREAVSLVVASAVVEVQNG